MHLGSITITGAQIGRQQRAGALQGVDEDNEYRHAFLIIEAKKGQSISSNPRHVLCAGSDADRDSWVDVLVRCVNGGYYDDPQTLPLLSSTYSTGLSPIVTSVALASSLDSAQPRSSTSSVVYSEQTLAPGKQQEYSRDDTGCPTHGSLQEDGNSPLDAPASSSLPPSSPLDGDSHAFAAPGPIYHWVTTTAALISKGHHPGLIILHRTTQLHLRNITDQRIEIRDALLSL